MRDVIQKILVSEAEAKQLVAAARAEADGLVSGARKAAADLRARVDRETRAEVEQILAEAARTAEREQQARVAQATLQIEAEVRLDQTLRRRAVAEVVRCVCGSTGTATKEMS